MTTATLPMPAPPEGLVIVRFSIGGYPPRHYRPSDLARAMNAAAIHAADLYAEARSEDRAVAAKYPQFDNSMDGVTDVVARAKWNGEKWGEWK